MDIENCLCNGPMEHEGRGNEAKTTQKWRNISDGQTKYYIIRNDDIAMQRDHLIRMAKDSELA